MFSEDVFQRVSCFRQLEDYFHTLLCYTTNEYKAYGKEVHWYQSHDWEQFRGGNYCFLKQT